MTLRHRTERVKEAASPTSRQRVRVRCGKTRQMIISTLQVIISTLRTPVAIRGAIWTWPDRETLPQKLCALRYGFGFKSNTIAISMVTCPRQGGDDHADAQVSGFITVPNFGQESF
jgi:hypothetical protein